MHMMATNICVWLRTIIVETIRDVQIHVQSTDSRIHGFHLLSLLGYSNKTSSSSTTTTTTTTVTPTLPQSHHYVVNGELLNETGMFILLKLKLIYDNDESCTVNKGNIKKFISSEIIPMLRFNLLRWNGRIFCIVRSKMHP